MNKIDTEFESYIKDCYGENAKEKLPPDIYGEIRMAFMEKTANEGEVKRERVQLHQSIAEGIKAGISQS
jgi:hypothetical protein